MKKKKLLLGLTVAALSLVALASCDLKKMDKSKEKESVVESSISKESKASSESIESLPESYESSDVYIPTDIISSTESSTKEESKTSESESQSSESKQSESQSSESESQSSESKQSESQSSESESQSSEAPSTMDDLEKCNVTIVGEDNNVIGVIEVNKGSSIGSINNIPSLNGYMFTYFESNGEKVPFDTVIDDDITLTAVYLEYNSVGFGSNLTAWTELRSAAGVSGTNAFGKDVEMNNFCFFNSTKQKLASDTSFNSQGGSVRVTLTNEINEIHMKAASGSSDKCNLVVTKDGKEIYRSGSIGSKGGANLDLNNLGAGTYVISLPKAEASGTGSLVITNIYYSVPKEYVNVSFDTMGAGNIKNIIAYTDRALSYSTLPTVQKSGYRFLGWCLRSGSEGNYSYTKYIDTTLTSDITLYASWELLTEEDMATLTYNFNVDYSINPLKLEKGSVVTLNNDLELEGYRFDGFYTDNTYKTKCSSSITLNTNTEIFGKFVKQYTITYKDGNGDLITTKTVDEDTVFGTIERVIAPAIENKLFDYWMEEGSTVEFQSSEDINRNVILVPSYRDINIDDEVINIKSASGNLESAIITVNKYTNAEDYSVYLKNGTDYTKLYKRNYYVETKSNEAKIYLFGLAEGSYEVLVSPVLGGADCNTLGTSCNFSVVAYDRSGFAHFNYTEGVGAYKDNGELKDNAIVLYVTDENKNDVELSYKGITVKGIGNILNSGGKDAGNGTTSKGGLANTNQGILTKLAQDNIPLVVRFVGCVSDSGLYERKNFNAANQSLIEGLSAYDSVDYGGTEGDNGHMARMQSCKNITLEGVGSEAVIDGWGFQLIAQTSNPGLTKNFEVRNLKFINTPEDAIGIEGVQESGSLTSPAERCWVHHNEFYCPDITCDTDSDKKQGDGSVDFKRGRYFTCSYNYYEGCHKTNLVGASDDNLQFDLTYHHNYYYECESRGPLTRQANVHMYNNVFYGQISYAMNTRANAYIFSEYNLFYVCKNPMDVRSGAIKSYNDVFSSTIESLGGVIVTDKTQTVSSGNRYENFDTNSSMSYIPSNDYYLQTDLTEVRKTLYSECGVMHDTYIKPSDVSLSDISYVNNIVSGATVNNVTKSTTVSNYSLVKNIYAFKVTDYLLAKVSYTGDAIICNEAGVSLLRGNGSVVLKPGTYFIQSYDFQFDKGTISFKNASINSLTFEEYDASEYMAELLADFNDAVSNIPNTITYTDDCYILIKKAFDTYKQLTNEAKIEAEANYQKALSSYNTFKDLGENFVEGEIAKIQTPISSSNSYLVLNARSAYNALIQMISDVEISNINVLINAENVMSSMAIEIFLEQVNQLPETIIYTAQCKEKLDLALTAYNNLDENQIKDSSVVSAYSILQAKISKYESLEKIDNVNSLISNANDMTSYKVAYDKYNELTDSEKLEVNKTNLNNMLVNYCIGLIDLLPETVSLQAGDAITLARSVFNAIDTSYRSNVTNSAVLDSKEAEYNNLVSSTIKWSADGTYKTDFITSTGKVNDKSATFDGVTYSYGLKLETSAGKITFTLTSTRSVIIYQNGGSKIKINGDKNSVISGANTFTLSSGSYSIEKGDGSAIVYAIFIQ